jgi:carbon-monoxide dehydrogenase small subunit
MRVSLTVNGRTSDLDVEPGATLLYVLREQLQLTGTKEGCVEGECGACTVLVDGRPVDSCLYAAHAASGREVTTIEGVGEMGEMSTLQEAMVNAGGVQCGFCTPGFIMTITALLDESPDPTPAEIKTALAGNICRCTGYRQIIKAIEDTVGGTA